jgi:UDP-2-acetamido-2,6-beta-L-arabino-hexul-4-ose reductase
MHILITGADGFVGRNLRVHLGAGGRHDVTAITRQSPAGALDDAAEAADFVFHLAGVNRPTDPAEYETGNAGFTRDLCAALQAAGNAAPVAFTSSTQAALDNPYGRSKRRAEEILLQHAAATSAAVHLYRLPNVFGKWSRPDYNSVVATFCHNIARGLPVVVHDPDAALRLVFIDDVVEALLALLESPAAGGHHDVGPVYETTVGAVCDMIQDFAASRGTLEPGRVGTGLRRALYATYVSFLPPDAFAYPVARHADPRGEFVEMLKTPDCGQCSYFTAHPGVTRGGHYHHAKTEKFLVIRGSARFGFRHLVTGERHEITVSGGEGRIVETAPGWVHDVTNVGSDELVCMLWANEVFDRSRPDTFPLKVDS